MLSEADVTRLMNERSPGVKIVLIDKISQVYEDEALTSKEKQLVDDIFMLLARDVEVVVRSSLAKAVQDSKKITRDLALEIAQDIALVSVPFVQYTSVLTNTDLIQIIGEQVPEVQAAIARRDNLDMSVTAALVEKGTREVVVELMSNMAAQIHENTYIQAVTSFGHHQDVAHAMAARSLVPVSVVTRLLEFVSDSVRQNLTEKYNIIDPLLTETVSKIKATATSMLAEGDTTDEDVLQLVHTLHHSNRLSEDRIMAALDNGDFRFFEAALSALSGVPYENVNALVRDSGSRGLRAIFRKSGLSEDNFAAVRLKVDRGYQIALERPEPGEKVIKPSAADDQKSGLGDALGSFDSWTELTK